MKEHYTLLGHIFCKWLGWHWADMKKHWHHQGKIYAPCKLCARAALEVGEQ